MRTEPHLWQFEEALTAELQEGGLPSHHVPLLRPDHIRGVSISAVGADEAP